MTVEIALGTASAAPSAPSARPDRLDIERGREI
jgi:hypothetical protein